MPLTEEEVAVEVERLNKYKEDLELWKQRLCAEREKINEEKEKLDASQSLLMAGRSQNVKTIVKGTIGNIAEYSLDDNWSQWYERLEMYFHANEVEDNKKVPLLLTLLGKEGYALLRNLMMPVQPSQSSLAELTKTMKDHLQPAPSVISERYKFTECRQREGEDIKRFLANLKRLSTFCEFGANLENSIRDQFVWGLLSEAIKKKLLGEKDLTFKRAGELALLSESAGRDAAEMKPASNGAALNFVSTKERQSKTVKKGDNKVKKCYCCGKSNHLAPDCKYRQYKCNKCGKQRHLQSVCKAKQEMPKSNKPGVNNKKREQQHFLTEIDNLNQSFDNLFYLEKEENPVRINDAKPITLKLYVENSLTNFEVDTGSPVSAISENDYARCKNLSKLKLRETRRIFKSYQGDIMKPKGILDVNVTHGTKSHNLELFVMPGGSVPIIGRQWLQVLNLLTFSTENIDYIKSQVPNDLVVQRLVNEFKSVFDSKLGTYNKKKVKLEIKGDAKPIFCKPRPVPFALREDLEAELTRLEREGIIVRVNSSDWATPIVPVLKTNRQLRVCGDFKITLNQFLIINRHPIPRVMDLASKMGKAKIFSKLDLAHAYQQLELDEQSKELVTISTHKGLFRYNRLPYGVATAPGLFQEEMENILGDIDGTVIYFDDVLVFGATQEEHNNNLRKVLNRFASCGLMVKLEKCQFSQEAVQFLGYEIDGEGLRVSKRKIEAIAKIKRPENLTELKAFLGMLNYYAKFIKNYAKLVSPLYELSRQNVKWQWTQEREVAFKTAKARLA